LPGPWLVRRALDLASDRAGRNGTCVVSIRRSHHIACLAAYLKPVADRGLMVLLSCSDPTARGVAPHGGRAQVMTPNPIAAAWPTAGEPVILDVSMSITTNGLTKRLATEGRKLPGRWALDPEGNPTDDPGDPAKPGMTIEQAATNLGVTIMASDEHGVPRLIRAIVPRPGMRVRPRFTSSSRVISAPARPLAFSPMSFFSLPTQTTANMSPPMPTIIGSTTVSTAAAVTAASIALPPRCSTARAADVASG